MSDEVAHDEGSYQRRRGGEASCQSKPAPDLKVWVGVRATVQPLTDTLTLKEL
ncbi:MAG: hypothetical protein VYD19_10110 [Myxococcota bacterium]|nr:hypothetical protein [Myxococcota bacterium]